MNNRASLAIAVFVKTPGYSPIKTRLAKEIGETRALEFYRCSVEATARVLEGVRSRYHYVDLFWAVAENDETALAQWYRPSWCIVTQTAGDDSAAGGLGARLDHVWGNLCEKYSQVILLGADSPHISVPDLETAIEALGENTLPSGRAVIGPTEDGGFYLFGSRREKWPWKSVGYSTSQTLADLIRGFKLEDQALILPINFDIDEVADLKRLLKEQPFVLEGFGLD